MMRKLSNNDCVGQELQLDSPNNSEKEKSKLRRLGDFCKDHWLEIVCVGGLAILGGIIISDRLEINELSSMNEDLMSENDMLYDNLESAENMNSFLEKENATIRETNEDLWKRGASISGRSLKKLSDPESGSFLYDFQNRAS